DRLLRDALARQKDLGAALREAVRVGRDLSPAGLQAVLERAALSPEFPRPDELCALLADAAAPDELIAALVPSLDLEAASKACEGEPRARRRLALLLDAQGRTSDAAAEERWLEERLRDPDV